MADQVGVEARTALAGTEHGKLFGQPSHVHQLISLMTTSLLELGEATQLDLQVAVQPRAANQAELSLQLRLASNSPAKDVCERLTAIATASGTLRATQFGEAESSFAVCWQLAQALGGVSRCEALAENEVCVVFSLPVETVAPLAPTENSPPPLLAAEELMATYL